MPYVRRPFLKHFLSLISISLVLLLGTGCVGFINKNQGNATGFAGAVPPNGAWYAFDFRSLTGFQSVVQVDSPNHITILRPGESVAIEIPLSAVTSSALGTGSFSQEQGLISVEGLLLDRRETAPTPTGANQRYTEAWFYKRNGGLRYDVVVRAFGNFSSPLSAKAQVYVSQLDGSGKWVVHLAGEFSVVAFSADAKSRFYTGAKFKLSIEKGLDSQPAVGTLAATIEGTDLNLDLMSGSSNFFSPPPQASSIPNVKFAGGNVHSCGLSNGAAYCWGENTSGQLGLGNQTGGNTIPHPVQGLPVPVSEISAGLAHTCAIGSGRTFCWGGTNSYNELGAGAVNGGWAFTPREVTNVFQTTSVAAGSSHTCSVSGKKAYCWGETLYGRLGNGTSVAGNSPPTPVIGISDDVIAVTVGTFHSCALTYSGDAYCWGYGTLGELGLGPNVTSVTTAQKINGYRFVSLKAKNTNTCGITDQGQVICWGDNINGEVTADGKGSTFIDTPHPISTLPAPATAVSVGSYFACALLSGKPYCWGSNSVGQLGHGTFSTYGASPVVNSAAQIVTNVVEIASGADQMLAYSLGSSLSWGGNTAGQLGSGNITSLGQFFAGPFSFP